LDLVRPGQTVTELAQAEIDLCSQIVRNVCGEHVYGRFKFDDFFKSLAGQQKFTVRIDGEEAQNVVITRCLLQALCEPKGEIHLEPLREHASVWFYAHLKYFVEKLDYFEPDREHLSTIGAKLSHILFDTEGIELWLSSTPNLGTIRDDLVVSDQFLEPMRKLLRNPYIANGYSGYVERKEWIQSVISAKANKFDILEKLTSNLATKWFTSNTVIDPSHFWIPYDVFNKVRFDQEDTGGIPSLHHIEQFLEWIRELTGLHQENSIWSYRVGAMYQVLQHPEEALRVLNEVEPQLADNWSFLLLKAEINVDLEDYSTALHYFREGKALRPALLGTDKGFKEMYRDKILLIEADCHRKTKDHNSAVECYQEILGHDIDYESYRGEIHADALTSLFAIWSEAANHAATLSFLRELKDRPKAGQGLSYWLGRIIGSRDALHVYVIKAAKHLGAVEEITQLYNEVIEPVTSGPGTGNPSPQVPIENIKSLLFFQAVLRFHCSNAHQDHVEALKVWEKLISISDPDNNWDDYWVVYRTTRILARALLDKGVGESSGQPSPTSTSSYVERLKTLCNSNQQSFCGTRQSVHDPHFCLVRLHLLYGNEPQADEEARSLLRGVFDDWPADNNDESLRNRFGVLAQILTVYGLKDDAIAAWQALKPRGSTNTASESQPDTTVTLVAGDEAGSDHSSSTDASSATLQVQLVRQPLPAIDSKPEAWVSNYACDSCGKAWEHMLTECWACRNCLCVQLCTPCHEKLLTDNGDPLVCSKQHEFIYLPKFDEKQWSDMPDEMVLVGGKLESREQWLNHLRERFDVKQEQIDTYKLGTARKVKATLVVANFVAKRMQLRKNRMKVTRRARTFPLLQVR
jgi:tetratricopeptide (TPR) repeat protein